MKLIKICFGMLLIMVSLSLSAQQNYGPKPVKSYDYKILKGKMLLIPEYEQMKGIISQDAFNAYIADNKVGVEYQRRWDSAIKISSWDFSDYKITKILSDKLKKEKDKTAIVLFYDKDFYQNNYANLAIFEPSYQVIATVPINGLDLSKIEDIRLLMNMLTFSAAYAGHMNDPAFKPFNKTQGDKYGKSIKAIDEGLKQRPFLVPSFGKEKSNATKLNEKLNNFMKDNWKLTDYDLIPPSEIESRVQAENFNGMYLKSLTIYTTNSLMPYYYFIVIGNDNTILYTQMGENILNSLTLKLLQDNMGKWLFSFTLEGTKAETEKPNGKNTKTVTKPTQKNNTEKQKTKGNTKKTK